MSNWTTITACIYVDTDIEDKNIKTIVEDKLKEAPKITGSEKDVDVFVNVLSGYNIWRSADCPNCPYKDTIIIHGNSSFSCEPDEDYKCKEVNYQTQVCVSVIGSLRDRWVEETESEYKEFLDWVAKNIGDIEQDSCVIK